MKFLAEENSLKLNFFYFYYSLLSSKSTTSIISLFILYILETIQLISYSFDSPHIETWKMSSKKIKFVSKFFGAIRIIPIFEYIKVPIYRMIFAIVLILVMIIIVMTIVEIVLISNKSKLYSIILSLIKLIISPLTIFLFIPILGIFLSPLKCYIDKSDTCWPKTSSAFVIIGIIASVFFYVYIFLLNYFYFLPFQIKKSTVKITSSQVSIMNIIKLIYLIRIIFVKNEYFSIAILLFLAIYFFIQQSKIRVYKNKVLQNLLIVRNSLLVWTYFILLVAKICEKSDKDNLLYLLVSTYPMVIFYSIMQYNRLNTEFNFHTSSFTNLNLCLEKTLFLIKIVNSFLDSNHNFSKYNNNIDEKNDLILKGLIKIHTETCVNEDCPLTKFLNNDGNFNVQKQCLLNYMTIYFTNCIKQFPECKLLRLYFIHFNFFRKYNLNGVKTHLEEVKKMKSELKDDFVIYCLENEIEKIKMKDINEGNENEQEAIITENNYKRLKELITEITKLYVEFWGIFAITVSNNLNKEKLYKLGEKLNIYLKEITNLWENNLKNKKINQENRTIAQLYARFLREIFWNNAKSEEVQKKINDEHEAQEFNKQKIKNLDNIFEIQDYLIYVNANEKGKCKINQFSNSLSNLIGYRKKDLLNKSLETIMPSNLIEGHDKVIEDYIKKMSVQKNIRKDSFDSIDNQKTFILIKNKMGYLVPFYAKFTLFDDNDFSNSFLIKAKLEPTDTKSVYAYYILTNSEFNIENISSSTIHLGITMDLLKKYVIRLNFLIRTSKNNIMNLFEKYKMYREEPKKITWVYPDLIYPKTEKSSDYKNAPIQNLIKLSQKKNLYMQIFEMKYNQGEILGFVFKFVENPKKQKIKIDNLLANCIPKLNRKEVNFDLLSLFYIRTKVVNKKSGLRNLREKDYDNYSPDLSERSNSKRKKDKKLKDKNEEDSLVDEDDNKVELYLTKEKILELQTKDAVGIKNFIDLLPFYGNDISLIKHRANREQYPAGKAQVASIKIDLNNFKKRIDLQLKENPTFYKKFKNIQTLNKENINNQINSNDMLYTSNPSSEMDIIKNNENKNKDFIESGSLMNIFNLKSVTKIKILDFVIYFSIVSFTILEFVLTYMFFNDNKTLFDHLSKSYLALSTIGYSKYFITEGILANSIDDYVDNKNEYIENIKYELSKHREELSPLLSSLVNPEIKISQEYKNYVSNTNVNINTLNYNKTDIEEQPFTSFMNKLIMAIFYVSSISENGEDVLNMNNKYTYELMHNLINDYYVSLEKLYEIISKDFEIQSNKNKNNVLYILIAVIFVSIILIFLFFKMMNKLNFDREKPINLFLTIRQKVFEDLKLTSESFSNKLLNKFFGNDETEEESQQEYNTNIKYNDINIAKFKSYSESKSKNNSNISLLYYFVQIIILFLLFIIIILLKYLNSLQYAKNIIEFNKVYNQTQFSHIFLILRIDVMKQYFYSDTLPSFNLKGDFILYSFLISFAQLGQQLGETIIISSDENFFLKDKYRNEFIHYFYTNFSDIIENEKYKNNNLTFKEVFLNIFENLRFICIEYFINPERDGNRTSQYIKDKGWKEIDKLLINFARPWYNHIIKLLTSSFESYTEENKTNSVIIFSLFLIIVSLYYWIIWKKFEDNFINLIKKSLDLINLIPEEIKNIIVIKLNE